MKLYKPFVMIMLIPIIMLLTGCTALDGKSGEQRVGNFNCWADCEGNQLNCDLQLDFEDTKEDISIEVTK